MEIIKAKSCKNLFVNCIISSLIINMLFYIIACVAGATLTAYIVIEIVQMCFNLFWGLLLRKANHTLLENRLERKKFAIVTLIGMFFLVAFIVEPDIIVMPYTYIILLIYNLTGLDRLITIFDYASILFCLGAVFFYMPSKHTV